MTSHPHILVHLHLFYLDQLPYFLEKLANITGSYDLICTVNQKNPALVQQLQQFHPNTRVILVENRGYDIWPFLQVIYQVDLSKYDYVLKLHSKRNIPYEAYRTHFPWREALVEPLLHSPEIFKKNLHLMKNNGGICASGLCFLQRDFSLPENTVLYTSCKKHLHIQNNTRWFIAGTMFLIKSKCLVPLQHYPFSAEDFFPNSKSNSTSTLAHALERIFIALVLEQNYKVLPLFLPQFQIRTTWTQYLLLLRYKFMFYITNGQRKLNYDVKLNYLTFQLSKKC